MQVLLLSMPDSFEHMAPVAVRTAERRPTSLAGNVDPHHSVAVADLVLVQDRVLPTVEALLDRYRPDVVGLSVMTFQRRTALPHRPHQAPAPQNDDCGRRVRPSRARGLRGSRQRSRRRRAREGASVSWLLRAMEECRDFSHIPGLTWRRDGGWSHGDRPVASLKNGDINLPNRSARVLEGYTLLGRQVDVIETSRGCSYDCSFCSIIEMRGRNFHIRLLARAGRHHRRAGARRRTIFIVDDNITLDVRRFEALCLAIIDAGLSDLDYVVQGMTSAIAEHGETLAPLMRQAGFRYVFLGIENVLSDDLVFLKARAKNARREGGRTVGNASIEAISHLHRHGMFVVGGLIVGNPDDTPDAIETNLAFARQYVDWPYIQHPTPCRAPMTRDFRERGLIVSEALEEYDGTTAVVRTAHLRADDVEFMRWKAERWMKVRHIPAALRHDPWFVLTHAPRMFAHTFRGSTWRTWLGLEPERAAFERYRGLRRREREYVPPAGREADASTQQGLRPALQM
jgi:hypothetical protein